MLKAGSLRHRITIQSKQAVLDRFGSPSADVDWQDVATVWAAMDATRGSEYFAAKQMQSTVTQRIRIRRRDDLKPAMRVIHNGTTYNIISILQDNRMRETVLMCEERSFEND